MVSRVEARESTLAGVDLGQADEYPAVRRVLGPEDLMGVKPLLGGHVCYVARLVLWWDAETLANLVVWKKYRIDDGARRTDTFVCSVQAHRAGQPLQRHPTSSGTATISNCKFNGDTVGGNGSAASSGAAILDSGVMTITGSSFSGNIAASDGS